MIILVCAAALVINVMVCECHPQNTAGALEVTSWYYVDGDLHQWVDVGIRYLFIFYFFREGVVRVGVWDGVGWGGG